MIQVDQRIKHCPTQGQWGDCHRACVASILELPYDEVPHFGHGLGKDDGVEFARREREFLLSCGYVPISVAYSADLEDILRSMAVLNPDTYYMLGGSSTNGTGHTVVCLNDEIVHNPNRALIIGPMDDGLYYVTFIGAFISVHNRIAERVGCQAQGRDPDGAGQDHEGG